MGPDFNPLAKMQVTERLDYHFLDWQRTIPMKLYIRPWVVRIRMEHAPINLDLSNTFFFKPRPIEINSSFTFEFRC